MNPTTPEAGAIIDNWAQKELETADFGDQRLTKRFIQIASDLAARPEASIPQACENWAETSATYRFLDNDRVTPEAIRAAHQNKTVERVKECQTVLALQDTTSQEFVRTSGNIGTWAN